MENYLSTKYVGILQNKMKCHNSQQWPKRTGPGEHFSVSFDCIMQYILTPFCMKKFEVLRYIIDITCISGIIN